MSRNMDEWEYHRNEEYRARMTDRLATFLEEEENWAKLKDIMNEGTSEDLRLLLLEGVCRAIPNPYERTMFGCYFVPDPMLVKDREDMIKLREKLKDSEYRKARGNI